MTIAVYAKATGENSPNIINRYDNFGVVEIPQLAGRYFVVSDPQTNYKTPSNITFDLNSPTKKSIHVKSATTAFYLHMSEAYHPQWKLEFNNAKLRGLGGLPTKVPDTIAMLITLSSMTLNGWYIDVPVWNNKALYAECRWPLRYGARGRVAPALVLCWPYYFEHHPPGLLVYLAYDYKKRHGRGIIMRFLVRLALAWTRLLWQSQIRKQQLRHG
jgi:hypothetical protein